MQVDSKVLITALAATGLAFASFSSASAQFTSTVVAQSSGKCLDVNAWQTQPGLPMEQWTCRNNANQNFTFTPASNGSYLIHPQIDGLCLDVDSSGWQVIQNTCNSSASQQWTPKPIGNGAYNLLAANGACLNVSGNSNDDGGNIILFGCDGSSSNERFTIPGFTPAATPAPVSTAHVPTGIPGNFTPLIDATFGTSSADATVKNRADLDKLAYYWFEYGPADTDPPFWAQADAPNDCMGPRGNGTDGLYGNFYSRFMHCGVGSTWDRHVISTDRLTLKASCGLQDNNPANCSDANIGAGMLRFIKSFRPTEGHPIIIEMKGIMPKGNYSWPAFWLNPGEQAPRNADGTPGSIKSRSWPPEIDIFDEYGFNNNTPAPGHFLIFGTPVQNHVDAPYASALCASQGKNICDLPLTNGGLNLPTTSVATFTNTGWFAETTDDLTAGWHTYGARIYTDHIDALLDGVVYRSEGFTWPADAPPMQLILSNQTAAKWRDDLSGITDQGGVPHGWDWPIQYVRVWQQN